jgi:hypothetical protein
MSVLQITASGVNRRLSPRLIDYEIEAELLMYLQRADRTLLGAIADHVVVLASMAECIRGTVTKLRAHDGNGSRPHRRAAPVVEVGS